MKTIFKTLLLGLIAILTFNCHGKTKPRISAVETTQLENPKASKHFIKVALLLDTSNSMDGLIDQAKAQLWKLVNELSYARCDSGRPNLNIALYEYGNDGLNSDEGYIRQILGFSDDLDEISKQLFSLTTNGGSEYCGQVIQTSINQLNWGNNPDDLKLIFIAGNEPFTQGKINYKHAVTNAKEKDITINTIFCGDFHQGVSTNWKDGADLTDGNYMAINHNKATVYIASPYDDDILRLNTQLNKTYVGYGKYGKEKVMMQAEQDINANKYGKANAVGRTISKSSHLYKNSKWDLVDALEESVVVAEHLDSEMLPEELKNKSKAEIESYLKEKKEERDTIQKEIQELNIKRQAYISEKQTDTQNGLENAMTTAIKTQAKKKNYYW